MSLRKILPLIGLLAAGPVQADDSDICTLPLELDSARDHVMGKLERSTPTDEFSDDIVEILGEGILGGPIKTVSAKRFVTKLVDEDNASAVTIYLSLSDETGATWQLVQEDENCRRDWTVPANLGDTCTLFRVYLDLQSSARQSMRFQECPEEERVK